MYIIAQSRAYFLFVYILLSASFYYIYFDSQLFYIVLHNIMKGIKNVNLNQKFHYYIFYLKK